MVAIPDDAFSLRHLVGYRDGSGLWKVIVERYEGKTLPCEADACEQCHEIEFENSESAEDPISRLDLYAADAKTDCQE